MELIYALALFSFGWPVGCDCFICARKSMLTVCCENLVDTGDSGSDDHKR